MAWILKTNPAKRRIVRLAFHGRWSRGCGDGACLDEAIEEELDAEVGERRPKQTGVSSRPAPRRGRIRFRPGRAVRFLRAGGRQGRSPIRVVQHRVVETRRLDRRASGPVLGPLEEMHGPGDAVEHPRKSGPSPIGQLSGNVCSPSVRSISSIRSSGCWPGRSILLMKVKIGVCCSGRPRTASAFAARCRGRRRAPSRRYRRRSACGRCLPKSPGDRGYRAD